MKFKKSIASGFLLIVLIVLMVGQGSLWTWFLLTHKKHNMEVLRDKVSGIAALIAGSSAEAIENYDFGALDRSLEWAIKDSDVISVRVTDSKGNIVREQSSSAETRGKSLNPFFMPWSNKLQAPVKSALAEICAVEVQYSGRRVNETMLGLLTGPPLGQALVFLVMIYFIYVFFQKHVGRPVAALNETINKVTSGDLKADIPEIKAVELDSIAKGLGFLTKGLSSTVSKMHLTADNVAMAIRQLRLTFGNVTAGMQKQAGSIDSISQSLKKANESQKSITEGAGKLSEFSSENVTSLLQMKTIADEIASSTGRLFQAVESSYSVVAEQSQTAKAIAENAERVLSSIEEALASVEEIGASVREVENSAKESTGLAEGVREVAAEKGIMTVSDAIDGMEKISEKVRFSVEIVRRLGARSKDIEKMLSVIKEVTEQTNLLSLNAAILATQAGEYGKGFSVVADEIRALSDRTAASTKEITGIVSTIQAEIADAVVAIESGMHLVDDGSAHVYKAGESMGSILEAAQKSARMARSIEKATEEQAKGLRQVSVSVDDIRKMVLHTTKGTAEQFKSSEYMLEKVGEVKEVAESTKRGTTEQAAGTNVISKNLELASERVNDISRSAQNQQKVNDGIISYIEQIRNIGLSTLRDVEAVSLSLTTLEEEIDRLRKEMDIFRVR